MKILVVDDDPDVVEVVSLCFSLRWPDAHVVSASNGEDALAHVEKDKPDLVLLDIVLPDTDGFQVCQDLREFSEVPVVMLSARDTEVDKVRGLEMGADDYITKPFSHLELLARVRAVMRRYESQLPAVGEMFESGGLSIDYASRTVTVEGAVVRLTPTEYSLLWRDRQRARRRLQVRRRLRPVWLSDRPVSRFAAILGRFSTFCGE
jgi:DNA-binding response OmpR family regulator